MSIINLGILAHVDAGKTTTAEQLLYKTGAIQKPGSVESGNTWTDHLSIEKSRGISVQSSSAVMTYKGFQINMIDTPGHMDFTPEVERALYAVDAVVLIVSAAEGIQSQTELFWKGIQALKLPVIFFVNKIDRAGCDPYQVLDKLKDKFGELIPLNKPIDAGEKNCSVVNKNFSEDDILALCQYDEVLEEAFLTNTPLSSLSEEEINRALIRQSKNVNCFPLVFGAASLSVGIDDLLNAIITYLPSVETEEDGELSGVIYKVEHDKAMGKIAHTRLFSGCIRNRDIISSDKVTQIRRITGVKHEDTGFLKGGDISALYGLSSARTGDIIGKAYRPLYKMATPLFSVKVSDGSKNPAPLLKAIEELSDENPLLDYEWLVDERELHIKVMGTIQLEILAHLLKERYNLQVIFSPPAVIYKETPAKSGIGFESYTMPKPCWAVIRLQIDPLERGQGFEFESRVRDEEIFVRYQNHIKESMPEALKQGLHGWEVVDLKVTLIGGEHHIMHTHPMDFFLATPMAVMNGLVDCGSLLLEPMHKVSIEAAEEFSSKIIGDILGMRGEFDSPVIKDGQVWIEALLPVKEFMEYPIRLSSLTAGKGRIQTEFAGYRECPLEMGETAKRRGVNPLDRAKWILYKRNAL